MKDPRDIIEENSLTPNKALGQNFLTDKNAIGRIVGAVLEPGLPVLEIGPGLGALTAPIAGSGVKLVCVELDSTLCGILSKLLPDNASVVNADFLKADVEKLHGMLGKSELVCAGNLPYYITSPIVMRLVTSALPIRRMVLMMQKEAAERFFAGPKDKNYVPLSVLAQLKFDIRPLFSLSPASYYPQPEVSSEVLVFDSKDASLPGNLPSMLKCAFAMRRKTLINNLSAMGLSKKDSAALLESCGIAPSARAEELAPDELLKLSEAISARP